MGHRLRAGQPSYEEGLAAAFAFLLDAGFTGPAKSRLGHAYTAADLVVEIWISSHAHETTLATLIIRTAGDSTQRAWLTSLYLAAGCGPAQDVSSSVTSGRALMKRLGQHGAGLQRLLPVLRGPGAEALFARCPTSRG